VLLASKLAHTIKYIQLFYTVVQHTGCLSVQLSICLSQPMTILKQLRRSTRIWSTKKSRYSGQMWLPLASADNTHKQKLIMFVFTDKQTQAGILSNFSVNLEYRGQQTRS